MNLYDSILIHCEEFYKIETEKYSNDKIMTLLN